MRCCGYDTFFDERLARKDADRYRRKGLRGSQRRILELLRDRGLDGVEVLEIGGGTGSLHVELLEAGAARATNVELSPGYEETARELLRERGLEDRVERRLGDAVEDETLPAADVVVLERVVCCYPDATALVTAAGRRARRSLALTYPRYSGLTRILCSVINAGLRIRGSEFRTYAHRPSTIRDAAAAAGLRPIGDEAGLVWRLAAFERP